MWRPQGVVPRYRRRAVLIWIVLIAAIILYSVLLVYRGLEGRKNPTLTAPITSNDIYPYPDLLVCLYNYYGCDKMEIEEECIMSINDTEGGTTRAIYRLGDVNETTVKTTAKLTDTRGWCVVFEMSAVEYKLGEDRDAHDYVDDTAVDMYWYPGGSANSSTCVQETGGWTPHMENIFAFLINPDTGESSQGIQIPYTCITNESSSHHFTYVGIGADKTYKVNGDEAISHKAQTVWTAEHKVERNTTIQAPYAYVKLELRQDYDSLVEVTEIDPFDLAEIVGQVGGFWDLLLFFWPMFFVAISYEAPSLKARDFRKSVVGATENLTNVVLPTVLQRFRTATARKQRGRMCDGVETFEDLPPWETSAVLSCPQQPSQENEVLIRMFEDHRLVAVVVNAPSRVGSFLQSEFGARYLKTGAPEMPLKNLLPPKTYLVGVPANATATSVATSIARQCKVGDEAKRTDLATIVVKVKKVSCSVLQSQALMASSYMSAEGSRVEESDVDLGEESEVLIRLFEDHRLVAVVDASSRVGRFLQSKFGARYLKIGAPEMSLKRLLPANTYLVGVPANATATSVATSIARHCKARDEAKGTDMAPLVVKVRKVSCSALQSQALAVSSYVSADGSSVEESVVDLEEGLVGLDFVPSTRLTSDRQREERSILQVLMAAKIPKEIPLPLSRPRLTHPIQPVNLSTSNALINRDDLKEPSAS